MLSDYEVVIPGREHRERTRNPDTSILFWIPGPPLRGVPE